MGDTGEWKEFSLKVSHCPSSLTLSNAFLRPARQRSPDEIRQYRQRKGLALELADRQDNILISPQASFNVVINKNDHTAEFPTAARYYATSTPVSAGTFNSVVQVTFTYQ